jgi:hypothetical protein
MYQNEGGFYHFINLSANNDCLFEIGIVMDNNVRPNCPLRALRYFRTTPACEQTYFRIRLSRGIRGGFPELWST